MSYYFVIYSKTSQDCGKCFKPKVTWTHKDYIIAAAEAEFGLEGGSFEEMAGVRFVKDKESVTGYSPERELTEEEVFESAIKKLSDEGRVFKVFEANDDDEFIEEAAKYGLREEALAVVEDF